MSIKPLSKQPEYLQAIGDINRMTSALTKVQDRLSAIIHEQATQRSAVSLDRHVESALRFAESGETRVALDRPAALEEERQLLLQQEDALKRAIQARHSELAQLVTRLSVEASRSMADRHKKLAERQAEALRLLEKSMSDEDALFAELHSAGYSPVFPEYVNWPYVGRLSANGGSAIWQRVRELERYFGPVTR